MSAVLRCVLGAPGGPVHLDRHSAGRGPGFDQSERPVRAGVGEQPRPPGAVRPGAREDLVGPPTEQEGVGALVDLVEERLGLVVEQRQGLSAPLEPAAAVLLRPAESLHYSVDGDVRDVVSFMVVAAFLACVERSFSSQLRSGSEFRFEE